MRRAVHALLAVLLIAAGCRAAAAAPTVPPAPTAWVTDTAGFLSAPTRQGLDTRLAAYQRRSGHQVLVWVGRTTGGAPLEEWAARAFQAWRVGRKGMDDGLVLFLLSDDRAARIEVGYGLEGQVPDAVASRILSEEVLPRIRAGDRDGAVTAGVDRLIGAVGGEGGAGGRAPSPAPRPPGPVEQILLGLFVVAVILFVSRYPRLALRLFVLIASNRRTGGGSGGGRAGAGFLGGGGRSGGGGASGRW